MKKCIVICNLNSGKGIKKEVLLKFKKILEKNKYEAEIIFTKHRGHAKEIMLEIPDVDLVISLGGDGTFNEIMAGNLKRDNRVLLSHIPTGTTNDIGAMYGLGRNLLDNLKLVLNGCVKNIDICTINNNPFVYVAGFGKFMNVPYETPRNLKIKYGKIAYFMEAIKYFFNKTRLYDITYTINDETYRGLFSFLIISNANRIAGINNFYKDIKLDDNQFEVLFCNLTRKKDIIKSLYYLTTSDITKVPGFYFHKGNNLEIKFNNRKKTEWCIDGEEIIIPKKGASITTINNVKILIPKKNINNLFIKKDSN